MIAHGRVRPALAVIVMAALGAAACYEKTDGPGPGGRKVKVSPLALPSTAAPQVAGQLSETERQAVYAEVMRAEAAARREVEVAFPELDPTSRGFSEDRFWKNKRKRDSTEKSILAKHRAQLAYRYGLNEQGLDGIRQEGLAKAWPGTPSPAASPAASP